MTVWNVSVNAYINDLINWGCYQFLERLAKQFNQSDIACDILA